MSRKISELQKAILSLALEKRFVTFQEILAELWGKKITQAQYHSCHASLSRSLTRLWRAGAVHIWKCITHPATAISLTNKGKMLAVSIIAGGQKGQV